MEFKQYLKILKANVAIIVIFTLAGLVVSLFASTKVSYPYKQTQLIFLQTHGDENTASQNYNGYYAQEKARNFTDTAVSIINSSDFQTENKVRQSAIDAKKLAPQLIRLTASAPNAQNQSEALSESIGTLNSKIKNVTGENFIEAKPLSTPSRATYSAPDKKIMVFAGTLAGFIFALCTIAAKTYFKL